MTLLYCLPIMLYFVQMIRFCDLTMLVRGKQFNLYLMLALALTLLSGCQTSAQKEQAKKVAAVRIHLENSPESPTLTQSVSLLRADPIVLTIDKEPIFTEANLVAASTVDTPGGFAIQLNLDESSTYLLEEYSADNLGKHFVIYGQWGDKLKDGRWLAAPIITRRITDGTLTFTPDMSADEANQLIVGLTNVIKKIEKGQLQ